MMMDTISTFQNIAKNNGGIITTSKATEAGISRALLWKLNNENKIQRIARGQYIFENDIQDELLSIGLRSDKIIFSHETALYLHGISDRTPFEHTLYLYDDKVITFNHKDGSKTIPLSQIENMVFNSDMNAHALPKNAKCFCTWRFLTGTGLERVALPQAR